MKDIENIKFESCNLSDNDLLIFKVSNLDPEQANAVALSITKKIKKDVGKVVSVLVTAKGVEIGRITEEKMNKLGWLKARGEEIK